MIEVRVPKMGMSTVEVDVVEIYVEVGEQVAADDALVRVEAEKAGFDILAPQAGTVAEILCAEDEEREVGDVVVKLQPH